MVILELSLTYKNDQIQFFLAAKLRNISWENLELRIYREVRYNKAENHATLHDSATMKIFST